MNWPLLGRPLPAGLAIVTSGYTSPRTIGNSTGIHGAIDFAAKRGTPVLAVADGTVAAVSHKELAKTGRYVLLEHTFPGLRLLSRSIHLDTVAPLQVGQRVRKGQTIGTVGSSGAAHYSSHLHLDIRACGLGAVAAYKAAFGWPNVAGKVLLVGTPGCQVVPAEPLVEVDGYKSRVITAARKAGIPLATERVPPPSEGGGMIVILLVGAVIVGSAAAAYYVWRSEK